jgi:hypothetical protein
MITPEPELNVEAAKQLDRLLHAHANWAHQAIYEEELPVEKKSFIYSPFEISDTIKTKYALLALLQQVSDQRVREEIEAWRRESVEADNAYLAYIFAPQRLAALDRKGVVDEGPGSL